MTGTGHGHGHGGLDDSPGFPTSSPYHSKDTLSPTAAPWAHPVPRAPGAGSGSGSPSASGSGSGSSSSGLSPAGSLGLGGAALRLPGDNLITLPRLGADLSGGDAAAGATFSLSLMGGASGSMPAPGAGAAAMAAAAASAAAAAGPRKAPEAVIDAGAPRMPARVGAAGGGGAAGGYGFVPARKRIMTAEDLKRFLEGQTVKVGLGAG